MSGQERNGQTVFWNADCFRKQSIIYVNCIHPFAPNLGCKLVHNSFAFPIIVCPTAHLSHAPVGSKAQDFTLEVHPDTSNYQWTLKP